LLRPRVRRLRQRGKNIRYLVEPATLLAGLREHLAQRAPESERPVPGGQHRGAHAAAAAITQQIGPRLGGLAVTVGERYQLLATVRAPRSSPAGTASGRRGAR